MPNKRIILFFLLAGFTTDLLAQFLGGQIKPPLSPYPGGTIHCNPLNRTVIVEVTNPTTGKIWMDRNLGAEQVATSSTDALAFGDLYQWGRGPDGHQCRNSGTTTVSSAVDQPLHQDFIIVPNSSPTGDWRNPQNNSLWQGINGTNNPCPSGFRIPTREELDQERISWSDNNAAGAYNSNLKLTLSGFRERTTGTISLTNVSGIPYGMLWTSSISGERAIFFAYYAGGAFDNPFERARGYGVRCIKN